MDANPIQSVPIEALVVGGGPRLTGENSAHVRQLMEVVDRLPPITVHRSTMRVIDGVHRLRAAHLDGRRTVEVSFFDGSEDSAFVEAVEVNVRHGLPLSAAERRAAAARIMTSHPDWSDRRIAQVAGLSARTVAGLRPADDVPRNAGEPRLGLDGRARPADVDSRRERAGRLITERPEASLREIARAVGISPETARDVRNRLARGEPAVPPGRRGKPVARPRPEAGDVRSRSDEGAGRLPQGPAPYGRQAAIVHALRRDPSLRFSEAGRLLLRLLEVSQAAAREWDDILQAVPGHQAQQLAVLAKSFSAEWDRLADHLGSRAALRPGA